MRSDAELLSLVAVSEREKFLKTLRTEQLEALKWNWKFWGRPDQLPPRGDRVTWLILAGRGWARRSREIRKRGSWIPGLFDHLSHKRTKPAADKVVEDLLDLKLDIFVISADPEAGVSEVAARLATGRLKVFSACTEWLAQYRAYRRDKAGDLIEESNGLMRATDLLALYGPHVAPMDAGFEAQDDWAAADATRNPITGYKMFFLQNALSVKRAILTPDETRGCEACHEGVQQAKSKE